MRRGCPNATFVPSWSGSGPEGPLARGLEDALSGACVKFGNNTRATYKPYRPLAPGVVIRRLAVGNFDHSVPNHLLADFSHPIAAERVGALANVYYFWSDVNRATRFTLVDLVNGSCSGFPSYLHNSNRS
ncbi:hypothetical protein PCASD_02774 [Puccinia coronata f. sp. avenae]|uniref:Uncharacterized protein n=1 Tax=Puccinia coronata f. sp. avenae TaxID=200324 RepID=A0A2N5VFU5_9BASI|nr:hypothetical protein PCASD_02774 [Puccinia coronata f. sp. avenae]